MTTTNWKHEAETENIVTPVRRSAFGLQIDVDHTFRIVYKDTMTNATKLSPAQTRLLKNAATPTGDRTPFLGNKHAGRAAAAWYRTAESLERMGLITTVREGDARRARATDTGRNVLNASSNNS